MSDVAIDINATDQKGIEERLAEAQARAQAVLQTAVNGIITIDENGKIESINPSALRMFGYEEEDVLGRNVKMLMPPPYKEEHDQYIGNYLRTGERKIIGSGREVEGLRKDGTTFPMELAVSELRLGGRRMFTGIVHDTSARKRAEAGLALVARAGAVLHQSLDYEATLEGLADLVVPEFADWFAVDMLEEGALKRVLVKHRNPAMVQLVKELQARYPPNPESREGPYEVIRTGHPQMLSQIPASMLEEVARDDEHLRLIKALGLRSYISVPIASSGKLMGALTLVTSDSAHHYDEQDLLVGSELGRRLGRAFENAALFRESELARAQLERANRAKDEFLGIVAHELRTPLTTVYGSARLVSQRWESLDEKSLRDLVSDIAVEAEKMVQLIENLLLLARVEMGQEPAVTLVPLQALANRVVRTLHKTSPDRDIVVDLDSVDTVACVPTYLEQMLQNLLVNADKYSPPDKPVELIVRREGEETSFAVLDRGEGVERDELPALFDSFYRSPRVAGKLPGKGLGLAVCRRLAEAQGGRVWTKLRPGGGLEVGFALPAMEPMARETPP